MLSIKKVAAKSQRNIFCLFPASSSLLLSHHPYSNSSAISPSQPVQPHHHIPIQTHTLGAVNPIEFAQSLKEWFRSGRNVFFDQIFDLLTSQEEETLSFWIFSQLGLRLSESFVLKVLNYGTSYHDINSCLSFFDWAGREGFHHTGATYHAIFKILSKQKMFALINDYLEKIVSVREKRKQHCHRFYSTLVMGYAVAGRTNVALQMFGRMRFQGLDLDLFSYCVLLNALVEDRCYDKADVIWKQIKARSIENSVTHTLKVKSLCRQKMLDEAVSYLHELLVNSDSNGYEHAVKTIVDGFCEDGRFDEVWELVEEFNKLGVERMAPVYGIWIKKLVEAGKVDTASRLLKNKRELEGYVPDIFRYNILLCRLLKDNLLEEVFDLLIEMQKIGICPDKVTMNAVLCFFCKAGMVEAALDLHNSKSEFRFTPNTMAFNYLINSLCGDGSYGEAFRLLRNCTEEKYFPSKRTLTILADALYREGKVDLMLELCRIAIEKNLMLSNSTYDKVIKALCRSRRVEDGYKVFKELDKMDKVASFASYRSLIHGFNRSSRGDIAARLLVEMQDKGHMATRGLFRAVICHLCEVENPQVQFFNLLSAELHRHGYQCEIYNTFIDGAGHGRRPELARKVYNLMLEGGVEPNLESGILMLHSYLKNGKVSDATAFFTFLENYKGDVSQKVYSSMIVGLCKAKKPDSALNYLKKMQSLGKLPSMQCYEFLIQSFCFCSRYDMVVNLITELDKEGHRITSFIGNTLLLHCLSGNELYLSWVSSIKLQNETSSYLDSLGHLIGAFSPRIRQSEQIDNFEELIEQCFPLTIFTYNLLLRRLSMSEMDQAFELFNRVCQKGYVPNQWTYEILVHGLFKEGKKEEARRWEEKMRMLGFHPTEQTQRFL